MFKFVDWEDLLSGLQLDSSAHHHHQLGGPVKSGLRTAQVMVQFPSHLRQIERVVSLFGPRYVDTTK